MKYILIAASLVLTIKTFSQQQCDCRQMIQSAVTAIEDNYADRENIKQNKYYQKVSRELKNKTLNVPVREDSCLFLIYDLIASFKDKHIGCRVERDSGAYTKIVYDSLSIKPVYERLNKRINNSKTIEGVWQSETNEHEYLIVKDERNNQYNVVVWRSINKTVKRGQLKGIIKQKSLTEYIYLVYTTSNTAVPIRMEKRGDKLYGAAIGTFRKKRREEAPAPLNLISSFFKHSDSIAILRLPRFDLVNEQIIDSILNANKNLLSQIKNLIIDLRVNFGGGTRAYKNILPWIYTDPIWIESGVYYSSQGNISIKKEFLSENDTTTTYWRTEKALIERMERSPGKMVLDSGYYIKYDSVYKYPEKVYVLVGERCMSAGELFLITARQSKKVIFLGENSNGVIDRADAAPAQTGCNNFKLTVPIVVRVPEAYKKPIDNIGIPPDIRIPKNIDWMEFVLNYIHTHN